MSDKVTENKWDYIKLRCFCAVREVVNSEEEPTEWEKNVAHYTTERANIEDLQSSRNLEQQNKQLC